MKRRKESCFGDGETNKQANRLFWLGRTNGHQSENCIFENPKNIKIP